MRDEDVIPDPQLMESMRAVGYTLETAVADIIDNSITAGGDQVDVWFTAIPEPRIAIVDNGTGMDQETLLRGDEARRPPAVVPAPAARPRTLWPRLEDSELVAGKVADRGHQAGPDAPGGPMGPRPFGRNAQVVIAGTR